MTELQIEPMQATLGAIVTGLRLVDMDRATFEALEDAFHAYALLVLPGQALGAEEQVAFARRFGEIEHLFGDKGYVAITNQRRDGSLMGEGEPPMEIMRGNEGWHTDSSYMPLAAKASVLSAQVVPSSGGETEWADMRAAYDALDEATRGRIAELAAHHSIRYSQAKIGDRGAHAGPVDAGYGYQVDAAPLRPLVKQHPVTGRAALYIGRHAYGIPGLAQADSEALLEGLMRDACRPPRVVRHVWAPGDVAIWDNRCLLHRARPFDLREPRAMRHVRIAGDPASEAA